MRIGVDIDGVLADFNESFIRRVIQITGHDLFPPRPFDIVTWNYPESYGYTNEEVSKVWESIKTDRVFWYSLFAYQNTVHALEYLRQRVAFFRDDLYFITARPGVDAKKQTELWLSERFHTLTKPNVTVLISSHKGLCARALNLNVYIDDRWENCLEVAGGRQCQTYLMNRPWNRDNDATAEGIIRTDSVVGICEGVAAKAA